MNTPIITVANVKTHIEDALKANGVTDVQISDAWANDPKTMSSGIYINNPNIKQIAQQRHSFSTGNVTTSKVVTGTTTTTKTTVTVVKPKQLATVIDNLKVTVVATKADTNADFMYAAVADIMSNTTLTSGYYDVNSTTKQYFRNNTEYREYEFFLKRADFV